jgi:hypothetical protein
MEFDDQISIVVVVVVVGLVGGKLTVLLLSPSPLSGASFQSSFRKDEKACYLLLLLRLLLQLLQIINLLSSCIRC